LRRETGAILLRCNSFAGNDLRQCLMPIENVAPDEVLHFRMSKQIECKPDLGTFTAFSAEYSLQSNYSFG
jgi:hypothetical protein